MDRPHFAVTSDEDGRGPGVEMRELRHLLPHLCGGTGLEIGIFHAILLHEGFLSLERVLLLRLLEIKRDDREALVAIFLVELDEILRLVMAIRAPGAGDDRDDDLVLEARIVLRDDLAVIVREGEFEGLVRIGNGRVRVEVVGLGKALCDGDIRPIGGVARAS